MFRCKRNFSSLSDQQASPSPILRLSLSPIKRTKLSPFPQRFQCSSPVRPETPPSLPPPPTPPPPPPATLSAPVTVPEPEPAPQPKVNDLELVDAEIEAIIEEIKQIREKTLDMVKKRTIICDYIEIVNTSQCEVRNFLNSIYYPGKDEAKRAHDLIEDTRRTHTNLFEKLAFELNQEYETTLTATKHKIDQVSHEIELHERTIATIESSDDCVIIEDSKVPDSKSQTSPDQQTPPLSDDKKPTEQAEPTEASPESPDEDELTDIDTTEGLEEEEERPFTPCQAQRPTK